MASVEAAGEEHNRLLTRFGRRFVAGELIFKDGDPAEHAFLLQEGRVRLIKRVGSVERSLRVLRPGDLFGESALMAGAPRNSTAVALEDGLALALDSATFQHVLSSNPAVGARVVQQLIRRLRDAEDQIELFMVRDAKSKVILALLKLAQQALGTTGRIEGKATLAISPMELSARVALDVDTVKRTIQELREAEYVQIQGERLEVLDVLALRELASLLEVRDRVRGVERSEPSPRMSNPRR